MNKQRIETRKPNMSMALWFYQEGELREREGYGTRMIIDAKGFEDCLHWPDASVTEMILPGLN